MAPKKVVIAVDASPTSAKAVEWAATTVLSKGDRAVLLHVEPGLESEVGLSLYPEGSVPPGLMAAVRKKRREGTEALVRGLRQTFERLEIPSEVDVVEGSPRSSILEAVTRHHAQMLVVGNRNLGPVERVFLGSVSKYCVHHSPCPVLVFREDAASTSAAR